MGIISIKDIKIQKIVDFWNRNLGNEFPMTSDLFYQNSIKNTLVCDRSSGVILNKNQEIMGLIIAKKNRINNYLNFEEKTGWIQIILVDKKFRKQGIGSALLSHAEKEFKNDGIKKIILGKDPYHYFPGIPSHFRNTIDWFENKSYKNDGREYDLFKKYSKNESNDFTFTQNLKFSLLNYSDQEEFLTFIKNEFPGRWHFEVIEYFNRGGKGREFLIAKEKGKIIGFCRVNDEQSPIISSNMNWSLLFEEKVGGIGPLGIASDKRGFGYGLLIVKVAILFLRKRDIDTIIIDWTTLVDFYKKIGYMPWKSYDTYSKYF